MFSDLVEIKIAGKKNGAELNCKVESLNLKICLSINDEEHEGAADQHPQVG